MSLCGFSGSRSLPVSFSPVAAALVAFAGGRGLRVAVGCAHGADSLVRAAAPGAVVFSVAAFGDVPVRQALASRSAALVRAVAASGPSALFVGLVSGPCPAGVVPALSWRSGVVPSGSWSSCALAFGLGVPLVVAWCGGPSPSLPAWGDWVPLAVPGCSVPCFLLSPAPLLL